MITDYIAEVCLGKDRIRNARGVGKRILRILAKAGLDVQCVTITDTAQNTKIDVFSDSQERRMKKGIYTF